MTDYRATPEQWQIQEKWAPESEDAACLLELRARIEALEVDAQEDSASTHFCLDAIVKRLEALEANSKPTSNPSQIRGSLVNLVVMAIGRDGETARWNEARAAIREVAAWLREQHGGDLVAATVLEQEAK